MVLDVGIVLYWKRDCESVKRKCNSFADPWYWVNPRIFPLYFPYKRKHCKSTEHGIVLYWKRDCESVKRKCSGFVAGCIPSSFWIVIKGMAIFLWM